MNCKIPLIMLVLALAIFQPQPLATAADAATGELTLYAHSDPSAVAVGGRVLGLVGNATSRQSADARQGLSFTLVPPLSASLHILGGMDVYIWLLAPRGAQGTLRFTIRELRANGSMTDIRSASVSVTLPTTPYRVVFGVGATDYTVVAGSTLRFDIQFTPATAVLVMLLWDDPEVATRIVLRVEPIPKIDLEITDASGRISNVFARNGTDLLRLFVRVSVENPFHNTDVRMVSLNVTNSSRFLLISNARMNLTSRSELPFRLSYVRQIELGAGSFNLTVRIRDALDRVFLVTRKITIVEHYKLVLILIDSQKRFVAGARVTVSADSGPVDEVTTNSTGMATIRAPSSQLIGSLTLQVRRNGTLILTHRVDLLSDSTLQLEAPLHDWNIVVRLQTLNLPFYSAEVDLYYNKTLIASNTTDLNGLARFTSIPLGAYEITVTSPLWSGRFLNVTNSPESNQIVLEVPIIGGISQSTILTIVGVAMIAVVGVFAAVRRKKKTRHFVSMGEILGGTIPQSTVMMIVGPSGSGKSLLTHNILVDSLAMGRSCVFVSNAELSSKIREQIARMGVKVQALESQNKLRFVDAYSGGAGVVSDEKYSVASPKDLTSLGIQLTRCLEEVGDPANVFLDSITPIVTSGSPERGTDFVKYYGARVAKSGGVFLFVITTAVEPELLSRFEEASDCVVQLDRISGPGKIRGRLLVKKARGITYEHDRFGFQIAANGRMKFVSIMTGET